ncbi:hypothetical protein QJQ45_006443 [Haematococcus lacustris]|nr:hypothetical protein QJQ45_006443 [Haematococcus lacustris]
MENTAARKEQRQGEEHAVAGAGHLVWGGNQTATAAVHSVELLKRGQKGSLRTCGLGTVVLKEGADAAALMQLLDGKDIMGRAVIVRRDKFVEDQASYTHPTAVETN